MEFIQKIIDFLGAPAFIGAAAFLLELAVRLLKTDKPKSVLYVIRAFLSKIPVVVQKIVDLITALINFIDSILPQNLKP